MSIAQSSQQIISRLCWDYGTGNLRHPGLQVIIGHGYNENYGDQGMADLGDPREYHFRLQGAISASETLFRQGRFSTQVSAFFFKTSIVHMILGSNMISEKHECPEDVGTLAKITHHLCHKVFEGHPGDLVEGGCEYLWIEDYQRRTMRNHDKVAVYEHYDSIVQHCLAALHIFNEVANQGRLTEEVILQTYRILTCRRGGRPEYRTTTASCSLHHYLEPRLIHGTMSTMMADLDAEIREALHQGAVDPVILAAKYSHMFDYIHPFDRCNGKMARLILNALMLRFSGVLALVGQTPEEREQYRNIMNLGTMNQRQADEEDSLSSCEVPRKVPYCILANLTVAAAFRWSQVNFDELCLAEPQPPRLPSPPLEPKREEREGGE